MKNISNIKFHIGSKEELLPDFAEDFPYIASKVCLEKHIGHFVPWHWHKAVELFYVQSGSLEYHTPNKKIIFPAGSGGMVNSNVLHMTHALSHNENTIQLLHIFDASLLSGIHGSRIELTYISPIINAAWLEIIPLFPTNTKQEKILRHIGEAFQISASDFGYELTLRNALSNIWMMLFQEIEPLLTKSPNNRKHNDKIKQMMIYIHEHYAEKISVSELAASAYLSERECFRSFQEALHMTPFEYLKSYRLQMACQMLANTHEPITAVSHSCGFGSSSYFGKVFRGYAHCTPYEYRQKWQDNAIFRQ